MSERLSRSGMDVSSANVGYFESATFALFLFGWELSFFWSPVADGADFMRCSPASQPSRKISSNWRCSSAANNTIRARFTSRCGVVGARQRASSTLRILGFR